LSDAGRGKRIAMAASTREKQQESAFTLSRHHEARLMVESSRGISRDGWQQEKSKTAVEPESGRKLWTQMRGGDGNGETAARKDINHQRVGGGGTKPDGRYGTSGRGGGHAKRKIEGRIQMSKHRGRGAQLGSGAMRLAVRRDRERHWKQKTAWSFGLCNRLMRRGSGGDKGGREPGPRQKADRSESAGRRAITCRRRAGRWLSWWNGMTMVGGPNE